jgi:hypothetical protein
VQPRWRYQGGLRKRELDPNEPESYDLIRMSDATVELANRQSPATRAVLIVLGFGVGFLPLADLWPGLISISVVAPIAWVIVVGALALAALLIGGAVFGYSTVLSLTPEGITLERKNLLHRTVNRVQPSDIGKISVFTQGWSDGPDSWRVEVELRGTKPLQSHDFRTFLEAKVLARQLHDALGRRDG